MTRLRLAPAQLCAAIVSLCLIGCDGSGDPLGDASIVTSDAGGDAGVGTRDSGPTDPDGGITLCLSDSYCDDGDPSTSNACVGGVCQYQASSCTQDFDCADFDACTSDSCVSGACLFAPIPDCAGCRSDAECDDGDASTIDVCDTFRRGCSHFPNDPFCSTPADCDDGNVCTDDQCNSSGTCSWGSIGTCCFRDSDCNDGNDCTNDACSGNTCLNSTLPSCGSTCPDYDGDGHYSQFCFPSGDDCDDFNSMVHPGATEICSNGVDDDCNGMIDGVDHACASGNTTCEGASSLALPATLHATIVSASSTGTGCGASLFYSLTVTETSDLTITMHFDDLPTAVTCPGCPPGPPPMHQIWHNLIVERTCADATTAVGALSSGGGCYIWDPAGGFFGGSRDHTIDLRRVTPGNYTVEIQARDFFGWMAVAIPIDITVSATPSAAAMCSGSVLTDGGVTHGTTSGGSDAFGLDCAGSAFASPEAVHTFTLSERRRVRLLATPTVTDPVSPPGVQLALRDACDPDLTPTVCIDTNGYSCQPSASLERILDAGTQSLVIESTRGAPMDYDLSLITEDLGAACAGAIDISTSGSFSGTTSAGTDHFRWNDVCNGGAAPEAIYQLVVAVPSRVVLDLIASYSNPFLRVISGCGETNVAGSSTTTHVDRAFDAGTYQVVLDGGGAADSGSYVLNATIIAM